MAEKKKTTAAKTAAKGASSRAASAKSGRAASGGKKTDVKNEESEALFRERRRFWSLILFFFGIFEIIVTFVKGDGVWNALYDFNRGMLGASVFLFGIFIIYMALTIASEKSKSAVIARALQGLVMILLLSAAAQIFFGREIEGKNLWLKLGGLYNDGKTLHGGGLSAALIGWPLLHFFKKTGAAIIIIMLIVLFALLLSEITLPQLLHWLSKPFVSSAQALREDRAERAAEREYSEEQKPAQAKTSRRAKERSDDGFEDFDFGILKKDRDKNIDFAKVHKAQSERIKREEQEAEKRASDFGFDSGADESTPQDKAPFDGAVTEEKAKENTDKKSSKKKKQDDKPLTKAEQVAEEKQKLAEQIKLDELIRKAANGGTSSRPKEVIVEPSGQTAMFEKEGAEKIPAYVYPPVEILREAKRTSSDEEIQREIQDKSSKLVETLETFGVKTRIIGIHRGPAVTRYELQPAAGVKVKQVTSLADDIALNLAADSVRIEAPIPGKPAIGIEIPNIHRDSVSMRELVDSDDYRKAKGKLSFAVGKDIEGNIVIGNIASMPHMLIAGTTGSGKSVFTNSIILNILFHASPDEVKLILIDPKKVEFPMYNGIPHLLIPVVTEPLKAAGALGWAVNEMMRRYKLFEANGTKNIEDYNEMVDEMLEADPECGRTRLPQIVIVVDEFADLMLAAKNEVEESVMRLAQLARAAGMHMLIATQSPRVDVLTGLIKANIPSRTALMVSNNTDSRVILDEVGAEKLLGKGDMLYKPVGFPKPMRIQSGFASTAEIREVVNFLKEEHGSDYNQEIIHEVEENMPKPKNDDGGDIAINPDDDLVNQAITIIVETGNASTAFLQRKLKLGFPRAARIMDDIEAMGIIGPQEGAKPRKILLTKDEWYERQGKS